MAYFRSLGELSAYVEAQDVDVRIVDPGIPLSEYMGDDGPTPSWKNQPSVRKVTGFAAEMISCIPLHLYQRASNSSRLRITDHPIAAMLSNPSGLSYDTPFRFWYRVLLDGLTADRWAARKTIDEDAIPRLTRIPVRRFRFAADGFDRIEHVKFWRADGEIEKHDPAQYALDVGYAARGANGTSPLVTMRGLLDEADEAVRYRRQLFANAARIPGVILRDTAWPAKGDARARFIAGWKAYRLGGGKEGADALLEDGMKYQKIDSFDPDKLESLEGRKLTDIEVCSAYHIPPELLGIREGTYSNMDALRQMLYAIYLAPYITAWAQAVNAAFRTELAADNLYIEPHMESVLRGSLMEQAEFAAKATGRPWMLTAEQRARFNLPHLDGTDELVTPLNVLIGGQANPTDSGSQNLKSIDGVLADMRCALERQMKIAQTAVGAGKSVDVLDRPLRELHSDLAIACAKHGIPLDTDNIAGLDGLVGRLNRELQDPSGVKAVTDAFTAAIDALAAFITATPEEE